MITTVKLIIVTICVCVCVVRTLKIYSFSKFQVDNTVLLTTVTLLYVSVPELIHLITESLYPLTNISPFPPLRPWQPPFYSLFP